MYALDLHCHANLDSEFAAAAIDWNDRQERRERDDSVWWHFFGANTSEHTQVHAKHIQVFDKHTHAQPNYMGANLSKPE